MAEKSPKRSFWLNLETLIIAAFFLFFIVWAMRKCNDETRLRQAGDDKYRQQHIKDSIARAQRITAPVPTTVTTTPTTVTTTTTVPTTPPVTQNQQVAPPQTTVPKPTPSTPSSPNNTNGQLWVVIDGLNVREKPELKAKSFGKLKLYDKVTFLGQVTEDTQKLSLGTTSADEPWVKIKTKRGTIGWVYGAGVSYYKTKKKGTL